MNILNALSSVGSAYSAAAGILLRYIPNKGELKTTVLHALIGVAVGVGSTFLVGFLYYLFGSTNETCQGAAAVCVARRDWAIAPAFFTFQFTAVVILGLLKVIGDGGGITLKIPGVGEGKRSMKKDVIPISWMVYGMSLGMSSLFGLMVLFDMYVLRAWFGFFVVFLLLAGFSFIHVIQLLPPSMVKPAKSS